MYVNISIPWALFACLLFLHQRAVNCKALPPSATNEPTLYSEKDEVEFLNKDNIMSLFGQERAAFVEFYSHWCGACQRYSKHWKEIAQATKQWHSKVIRVAAINCADQKNSDTCADFGITYYPALKLIPAYAKYENKEHDAVLVKTEDNSVLIKNMIDFIDLHERKPPQWPLLSSLEYKTTEDLFSNGNSVKHALLLLENKDSYLGRKVILEFSSFTDRLVIRRVTDESSPELYNQFNTYVDGSPSAYIITNDNNRTSKHFDKTFVDEFAAANPLETGLIKSIEELEAENVEANVEDRDKNLIDLIHRFIQYLKVGHSAEVANVSGISTKLIQVEISNQKEYLKSDQSQIFMQDLESGLSLMLRSDVAANKFITGEKLSALKEVVRVLVKFFPGREPVRNYLVELYGKIKNKTEITGDQWRHLVSHEGPTSFLPAKVEWHHCKGSTDIYRGYPCSLWTIFHVLTVSQVEKERTKPRPFTEDFDVQEVVNAIRLFVFNFFTCKECVENFKMETENWKSHLAYSYDAVKYLWKVHNSVNERLKKEENNDPAHPKELFPSKAQCPKCYRDSNDLKAGEPPFVSSEVLAYLQLYYSKFHIEGAAEMNIKKIQKPLTLNGVDSDRNRELLGVEKQENLVQSYDSTPTANNTLINFSLFLVIITVVGLFLMFYGYSMKRERMKAHII